ncbi:MAG: conjugal transfer protein TraF [Oleispira sp.]|nr:conjugal transfer protein TraF [Oleispira sp.]MBL4882618.1 conjugal transfer protein TraF [Oleispira sp.]
MIKRSLLASSISLAILSLSQQASAAPLLPIDARGLAMGGTGVASARYSHAPLYNPALLSTADDDEGFAIVFPQIGIVAADEDEWVDTVQGIAEDDYKTFDESLIDHFTTITENLGDSLTTLESDISSLQGTINGDLKTLTTPQLATIKSQAAGLESSLLGFQAGTLDLKETTFDLTSEFDNLSAGSFRLKAGINGVVAIPSETFGMAISFNNSVIASGRTIFSEEDQQLINGYAEGVNEYSNLSTDYISATNDLIGSLEILDTAKTSGSFAEVTAAGLIVDANQGIVDERKSLLDGYQKNVNGENIISVDGSGNIQVNEDPTLTSLAHVIAIAISEIGLTLSRNFNIAGQDIAIGITPKFQIIKTFNYVAVIEDDDFDEEALKDTEQDFSDFNIDAGIAYQFGADKQWQAGLVAKNLLSKEYEAESNTFGPNGETLKTKISLDTQFRGGISHTTDWTVVAIDLDLMENDPIAFEAPTQYASIGAELDLYDLVQLRGGYRTNLSVSNSDIVSVGLGFSPFALKVDLTAMANPSNPEQEFGAALELGLYF